VSILNDKWCICIQSEDRLCYGVVVQCLSHMLCSFITDIVSLKIKSGECLYENSNKLNAFKWLKVVALCLIHLGIIFFYLQRFLVQFSIGV
jgi:hypothetical protein